MTVEQLIERLQDQVKRDHRVKKMQVTYGDNLTPLDDLYFERDPDDDSMVVVLDW